MVLRVFPKAKEESRVTLTTPSHHRLTLEALHPLQEAEKFTWKLWVPRQGQIGSHSWPLSIQKNWKKENRTFAFEELGIAK